MGDKTKIQNFSDDMILHIFVSKNMFSCLVNYIDFVHFVKSFNFY